MATDTIRPQRAVAPAATRTAAIAAFLFAATLFVSMASLNVPAEATDAELLAWWQDTGNQSAATVSMFSGIAAAIFYIIVVNHIRVLVSSAGAGVDHLARFAYSMSAAFSVTLLVTSAVRGVIGSGGPLPGVDVLRYSTSLGHALLDNVAVPTLALSIVAVSLAVLRARVLARWVAILGVGCAAVIAGAVVASVGAFAIPLALIWALALASPSGADRRSEPSGAVRRSDWR